MKPDKTPLNKAAVRQNRFNLLDFKALARVSKSWKFQ
jgi:hypothetical protein